MPNQLINYFRDCYLADQREMTLWSIFDSKIEDLHILEGEEQLVNGKFPKQYIEDSVAQKWLEILQVYSKEKQLLYFSLMVSGDSGSDLAGRKQICAPLVYYPVEISQDEDNFYYASINFSKRNLNFPLLALLNQFGEDTHSFLEHIFEEFPPEAITFEEMEGLRTALKPYFPNIDFEELMLFPKLADKEKLKSQQRSKSLKILPASAIGLVKSSRQTRGVLNELKDLSGEESFSKPIQELFRESLSGIEDFRTRQISKSDGFLESSDSGKRNTNASSISNQAQTPTRNHSIQPKGNSHYATSLLSEPQHKILENASKFPLSVAIGPPGTGKSYTIAAIAIDQISRGNSVLIASRMNHAVDVVADKIETQLGLKDVLVRAGRSDYLKELKKSLANLFSGISSRTKALPKDIVEQNTELHWGLPMLNKLITEKIAQFDKQIEDEQEWAKYLFQSEEPTWFGAKWWRDFQSNRIEKKLENLEPLWSLIDKIHQVSDELQLNTTQFLQARNTFNIWEQTTDKSSRKELKKFSQAIRARTGGKQEQLFSEIDFERVILHTFPIWLANLADVSEALPLQTEMFDVAIIDEATQCDIASCLPILQRAKRIVVVGDPHQLRHLSFLSRARASLLQKENGFPDSESETLNYREKSILDFALEQVETQEAITFLDEHFRSHPQIIGFSNEQFYEKSLRIMQKNPQSVLSKSVELVKCEGKRAKNGSNKAEASWILQEIKELIEQEPWRKRQIVPLTDNQEPISIGILSPFRDQVDYIRKQVLKELAPEAVLKHEILVGTAHSFQGEERDVMFISFAVDNDSAGGSFTHLNKADIFNVSITRAKSKQYILLSASQESLNPSSLLYKYVSWIGKTSEADFSLSNSESTKSNQGNNEKDTFLEEVIEELTKLGFKCFPQFAVAGIEVDLVVSKQNQSIGIDLIGWEGTFFESFSLERYQILQRAGMEILPLSYNAWRRKREVFLGVLEGKIN